MSAPRGTLQTRKHQLVRDAIWDAAIDLFEEKGFDEATVEEISHRAGVSRRSFFRYYASKKDLMAQGVLTYGTMLRGAIEACPQSCTLLEILRQATLKVARVSAEQPRTRQIFRIANGSAAAYEALLSALPAAEKEVAEAFESRLGREPGNPLKPKLLASLTLALLNTALACWGQEEPKDISIVINQAFATLSQLASQ